MQRLEAMGWGDETRTMGRALYMHRHVRRPVALTERGASNPSYCDQPIEVKSFVVRLAKNIPRSSQDFANESREALHRDAQISL
jgi:hypothetical protein